jgi:hypothetical protein
MGAQILTIGRVIHILKDDQDHRVFEIGVMVPRYRVSEDRPRVPNFAAPLRPNYDQRVDPHGTKVRGHAYWDKDQIVAHALEVGPDEVLCMAAQGVLAQIWQT